ncbi:hypothetical protein M3914_003115 [Vibrio metschnikovii]|nr:hypothetical protein [Vibrio metschnikovii]
MYTILVKNDVLYVEHMQVKYQHKDVVVYKTKSLANAALAYLSLPAVDPEKNLTARWKQECGVSSMGALLYSGDLNDLYFYIDAQLKQQVEFIFEEYVINVNPDNIQYHQYNQLDIGTIDVIAHTPTNFSLLRQKENGSPTLIASYKS